MRLARFWYHARVLHRASRADATTGPALACRPAAVLQHLVQCVRWPRQGCPWGLSQAMGSVFLACFITPSNARLYSIGSSLIPALNCSGMMAVHGRLSLIVLETEQGC
jgi:hypothetical protein